MTLEVATVDTPTSSPIRFRRFAPWVRISSSMQFSLRTMLIATTLVALVLGVVVWMVK